MTHAHVAVPAFSAGCLPGLRRARRTALPALGSATPRATAAARTLPSEIALVGVTGGTGLSAVCGFVAAGVPPHCLRVLTRNPSSPRAQLLASFGVRIIQADLDNADGVAEALRGATRVYIHALAPDTGGAEGEQQASRAASLALALQAGTARDDIQRHVVYHSAAGIDRCAASRMPVQMRQKACVEAQLEKVRAGVHSSWHTIWSLTRTRR